jgi:hypothetical protein
MARRIVDVLTVPRTDSEKPMPLGRLIDPGDGREPFGDSPVSDRMLNGGDGRREKFEYYYAGWSNGYTQTKAA